MPTAPLSIFAYIFRRYVPLRHLIPREVHSSSPALLTRKGPLRRLLVRVRFNLTLRRIWSLTIARKLRPLTHSSLLYRTVHNSAPLSCETFRGEPATRRFDWSFAPTPKSRDRFERQNHYVPPPAFPQASHCPGIAHRLSGLTTRTNAYLLARTPCKLLGPCFKTGATRCLPRARFLFPAATAGCFLHSTYSLSVSRCI